MARETPYTKAMNKAHSHLLRGHDIAWERAGSVQLGQQREGDNLSRRLPKKGWEDSPEAKQLIEKTKRHHLDVSRLQQRPAGPDAGGQDMATSGEPSGWGGDAYDTQV